MPTRYTRFGTRIQGCRQDSSSMRLGRCTVLGKLFRTQHRQTQICTHTQQTLVRQHICRCQSMSGHRHMFSRTRCQCTHLDIGTQACQPECARIHHARCNPWHTSSGRTLLLPNLLRICTSCSPCTRHDWNMPSGTYVGHRTQSSLRRNSHPSMHIFLPRTYHDQYTSSCKLGRCSQNPSTVLCMRRCHQHHMFRDCCNWQGRFSSYTSGQSNVVQGTTRSLRRCGICISWSLCCTHRARRSGYCKRVL